MTTEEFVAGIRKTRDLWHKVEDYNAPIEAEIEAIRAPMQEEWKQEIEKVSVPDTASSRKKAESEESILALRVEYNRRYNEATRELYDRLMSGCWIRGAKDIRPYHITYGPITIEQAMDAAKQLYDETPKWLEEMNDAYQILKSRDINTFTEEEYVELQRAYHGGDECDKQDMNIVMNNVYDIYGTVVEKYGHNPLTK